MKTVALLCWSALFCGCIENSSLIELNLHPIEVMHLQPDSGGDGGEGDAGKTDASTGDGGQPDAGCEIRYQQLPGLPTSINSAGAIGLQLNRDGTGIAGVLSRDGSLTEIAGILEDGGLRETQMIAILETGCAIGNTSQFIDYSTGGSPEPFLWCPVTGITRMNPGDGGPSGHTYAGAGNTLVGERSQQPSKWSNQVHEQLQHPFGFTRGSVYGISSQLQSVGFTADGGLFVPTLWDPSGLALRLNSFNPSTIATGISETGLVVGFCASSACSWNDRSAPHFDVTLPGGYSYAETRKVRRNIAFGYLHSGRRHGAAWRKGVEQLPDIYSEWVRDGDVVEVREITDISQNGTLLLAIGFELTAMRYIGLQIERINCD